MITDCRGARTAGDDVRHQILEAANDRFQQYGYGKTTMAEIASDCSMSASNLYRYFENKQDMGAELATECLNKQLGALKDVVTDTGRPAGQRIESFILAMLHHTHHHWSMLPRLSELVDAICEHRTEIVVKHRNARIELLAELIRQGVESGEFSTDDINAAAEAILIATVVFDVPHFMGFHSLQEFERIAGNLSRVLVNGLVGK